MAEILEILKYPNPRLTEKAMDVEIVDDYIMNIVENMIITLESAEGVGLAATQVGIPYRIVIIKEDEKDNTPKVFINPVLTPIEDVVNQAYKEGCLSFPGFDEAVIRPSEVDVEALDATGEIINFRAKGFMAVVLQHEVDHLDGILFVDRLPKFKQQKVREKYKKRKSKNKTRS